MSGYTEDAQWRRAAASERGFSKGAWTFWAGWLRHPDSRIEAYGRRQELRLRGSSLLIASSVYRVSNSRVFARVRISRDRGKLLTKGDIRVCPETDAEMGFRWSG